MPGNTTSLVYDWEQKLFSDIYTVNADQNCTKGDRDIIVMPWQGAMDICYAEDVLASVKDEDDDVMYPKRYFHGTCSDNRYGRTNHCKNNVKKSFSSKGCVLTGEYDSDKREHEDFETKFAAINMTNFFGKKYCGKTIKSPNGGYISFDNITLQTKSCKSGLKACPYVGD